MLTFNIGPSKLNPIAKKAIAKAVDKNILEISHRSKQFSEISKKAILGLRDFFKIPKNYKIFYTPSAVRAIELAITNCCEEKIFSFTNGNFSKYFPQVAEKFGKKVFTQEVEWGASNDFHNAQIPKNCDLITLTHNETSTGVMYGMCGPRDLRKKYPQSLITVDITSSAGAAPIDIRAADIWLFSVQKCFGLPAGLGILIVSPRAFEQSIELEKKGKNLSGMMSFEAMEEKMIDKYQTIYTPNVLNIFLLAETLAIWNKEGGLRTKILETQNKFKFFKKFIENKNLARRSSGNQNAGGNLKFFVKEKRNISPTTICIESSKDNIAKIHKLCKEKNIILGNGYGKLKETTIRIANFPAITMEDLKKLIKILEEV